MRNDKEFPQPASNVEAFAAATLTAHVGVVELEAFVQPFLDEIELGTEHIHHGARLDDPLDVVDGDDFTESSDHAARLAEQRGALRVPSFHRDLVRGVATYWWEFLRAVPQLDAAYVPIGLGSGACAAIAARQALGHRARIVGVVSSHATTYADSLAAGRVVEAPATTQLADGMAVRRADAGALAVLREHLDHIVQVSDGEVAAAMRAIYVDTHNVAEGAGAAAFAAAMQERERLRGQSVGVSLTGGNVDAAVLASVLQKT